MSVTDPIADFLTRIRNASKARKIKVEIPSSKMKAGIAEILKIANKMLSLFSLNTRMANQLSTV